MRIRFITLSLILFATLTAANAQLHTSAFHVSWNILTPLTDKEYISSISTAGMQLGYTKFINDRFGFGIEGGYSTLHEYVPRTTYEYPGGAVTTDLYNYLYYYTLLANGQYYFKQTNRFTLYGAVGAGVSFNEYRVLYNVYADSDNLTAFVCKPDVGLIFKIKEYSNWGLKSSVSYQYTTNKSTYFEIDNFSAIGFHIGVVFLND